ncbi:MAG: hypothetical protein JNM93_04325 [Bacteriovoracaceae bacterium]|nr:hypothetical protein [Bacteriovoracaceae bacterium]
MKTTFARMRDNKNPEINHLLEDLLKMIDDAKPEDLAKKDFAYLGPAYRYFEKVISDPTLAKQGHLLTARWHAVQSIYKVFLHMQAQGYWPNIFPLENYLPTGDKEIQERFLIQSDTPPEMKAEVLSQYAQELSELQKTGRQNHRILFFDDDPKNVIATRDVFIERQSQGAWPKVDLYIAYLNPRRKMKDVMPEFMKISSQGKLTAISNEKFFEIFVKTCDLYLK